MNAASSSSAGGAGQLAISLGALGVVFGDIGTSPLYTLKETLDHLPAGTRESSILGALSLMFWSLTFAGAIKYLGFITRADNRGEGGMFALLALGRADKQTSGPRIGGFTLLLLFGAALLFGDGVITPAISVLGAAEGLTTLHPAFEPLVPWITAAILAIVFAFQHHGSRLIGRAFGPVMAAWFLTIAVLGVWHIAHAPSVLMAFNPLLGARLLWEHPGHAAAVLGSVTLCITGAEALYADMGHFGRRPIVRAWYCAAFPGLALSYFGQAAYALAHPADPTNPFFAQVPEGPARWALIALSTAAAVIASQALISGTYSLARQAIQLGYFPRLHVKHTNPEQVGQIYVPLVNIVLALLSISVVLAFGSVKNLTSAYGVAVTGTMVITTLAFYRVARVHWNWSVSKAGLLCAVFLIFDLSFFGANLHKFFEGGWLPFVLAAGVFLIMYVWKIGRTSIRQVLEEKRVDEPQLLALVRSDRVARVDGVAVFMAASPRGAPVALLHHVKSSRSLQRVVVLLSIVTDDVPVVSEESRLLVSSLGEGLWRVVGRFGYMESPDAAALLQQANALGVPIDTADATYYFNREMIMPGGSSHLRSWQKDLYAWLTRNARPAKDYFNVPPAQIVEMGLPVLL